MTTTIMMMITMTTTAMTMTTETIAEPRIAAGPRSTSVRRPHAAAGSRTVTLALSITATAGLMIAMGSADAQSTVAASLETSSPVPEATVVTVPRSSVLLPVPSSGSGVAAQTPTVSRATPQPIVLQPQRRVVVKSNGSR